MKKYPFLFFRKNAVKHFLLTFKANYRKKNAQLPPFLVVDSNSPCKDLLFPHGPNLEQKPLYLVITILNRDDCRAHAPTLS